MTSPVTTATCSSATASASPVGASPAASAPTPSRCSPRSTTTTAPACPAAGPWPSGPCHTGQAPNRSSSSRPCWSPVTPTAIVGARTSSPPMARLPLGTCRSTPPPASAAGSFQVAPITPVETYLAAVAAARDAVRDGQLVKAVIAREVGITAEQPISVRGVLARLRAGFGSSYRYSIDGLLGASPELLIEVRGDMVRSHPLAGTAPRTGDPTADARIAAGADRQHEGPGGAPRRDRRRARHAAAVLAATSTGSRSRRSSPSPTCSTSAPRSKAASSQPAPERARAGPPPLPHTRRSAAILAAGRHRPDRTRSRASTVAATAAPSAGSTRPAPGAGR